MPYITRDNQQQILRVEQTAVPGSELINPDSPELWAFLFKQHPHTAPKHYLNLTDDEMIRVVEDVVDVLLKKNILLLTDLPTAVQSKIQARKQARDQLGDGQSNFLVEENDIL